MIEVTVKTPYDKDLTLYWDNLSVKVKGSREALVFWERLKSPGLYGMYGYLLNLDNCDFKDLINALSEKLPLDEFSYGKDGENQIKKEVRLDRKNPLPKGAVG